MKSIRLIFRFLANQNRMVFLISALAFLAFYWNAYFSDDFRGMLGYETKDTITELQAYFNALDQGGTIYWDPYYFHYTPTWPQAPIFSPVTIFFLIIHKLAVFSALKDFFAFYLVILALIQIFCVYSMYVFLRYCGLDFMPSVLGGLAYAYNHQTFVFGIRHGYERISAILLAPLVLLCFFKFLDSHRYGARYRKYMGLTALLFGLCLTCNGDVKPTLYFALFMVIAALLRRPFSFKLIGVLFLVFLLGGGVFLVQGLLTGYAYGYTLRSHESVDTVMEFSLRPIKLLLTHISTGFTDRPDYPWENTVEFSLSFILLVFLGLFHFRRHRWGGLFAVTLIFCWIWIMGRYTPAASLIGLINRVLAMHIPTRMAVLLYFCYAFFIALGVQCLSGNRYNRIIVLGLWLIPVGVLGLYLGGLGDIPFIYIAMAFFSQAVLCLVAFQVVRPGLLWLIVLFFMVERTTIFSTLKESNIVDPTEYYTYDEIYRPLPRVKEILKDPSYRDYRAFFGIKDFPELFSHNFYLNAFSDRIRPIFAYFYLDHQWDAVNRIKYILLNDWSHPMWNLLNVKYLVDVDRYIDLDTERAVTNGLDHLVAVDERVRINPDAEKEIFIRYRSELIDDDELFLAGLRDNKLDVKKVAYLNSRNRAFLVRDVGKIEPAKEEVKIISRKTDEIEAEITVFQPALVIFSEYWFFPWEAEVDGRKAELFRVYNILQGVKVDPGRHRVRFYFNSWHWRFILPTLLSGVVILSLLTYIIYWHCREKKSGE